MLQALKWIFIYFAVKGFDWALEKVGDYQLNLNLFSAKHENFLNLLKVYFSQKQETVRCLMNIELDLLISDS